MPPSSSRLVPVLDGLAEMARENVAPFWAARLVAVADGDEWERAVAFDALAVVRWFA